MNESLVSNAVGAAPKTGIGSQTDNSAYLAIS